MASHLLIISNCMNQYIRTYVCNVIICWWTHLFSILVCSAWWNLLFKFVILPYPSHPGRAPSRTSRCKVWSHGPQQFKLTCFSWKVGRNSWAYGISRLSKWEINQGRVALLFQVLHSIEQISGNLPNLLKLIFSYLFWNVCEFNENNLRILHKNPTQSHGIWPNHHIYYSVKCPKTRTTCR